MRRWLSRAGLCLALLAAGSPAAFAAQQLQQFVRGSYQQIVAARAGKPFIVAFWSQECGYCGAELAMFGKLLKKHRSLDLVLVSTDSPTDEREIAATLKQHALGRAESWVFADSHAERLRFEIDREWYGELPRSYFFGRDAVPQAFSGKLERAVVERWLERQR